jgi:Leucine-rich repeat (LRR) protein
LRRLRELNLARNQISDISPLAELTSLELVALSSNRIESLGGVLAANASLGKLKTISLEHNCLDLGEDGAQGRER